MKYFVILIALGFLAWDPLPLLSSEENHKVLKSVFKKKEAEVIAFQEEILRSIQNQRRYRLQKDQQERGDIHTKQKLEK